MPGIYLILIFQPDILNVYLTDGLGAVHMTKDVAVIRRIRETFFKKFEMFSRSLQINRYVR